MPEDNLFNKSRKYLETLCCGISGCCVGSIGNRQASYLFDKELSSLGWETEMSEFDAMDWEEEGAILRSGEKDFNVLVSPYSPGFKGEAELISASTVVELEAINAAGKILLLHGDSLRNN